MAPCFVRCGWFWRKKSFCLALGELYSYLPTRLLIGRALLRLGTNSFPYSFIVPLKISKISSTVASGNSVYLLIVESLVIVDRFSWLVVYFSLYLCQNSGFSCNSGHFEDDGRIHYYQRQLYLLYGYFLTPNAFFLSMKYIWQFSSFKRNFPN